MKTRRLERIYRSTHSVEDRDRWKAQFELQRQTLQQLYTAYWTAVILDSQDTNKNTLAEVELVVGASRVVHDTVLNAGVC